MCPRKLPSPSDTPLDAPVRAETRAGLDRAELLGVGRGYLEASAGVDRPWGGQAEAFARLEAGAHPFGPLSLFAFGQVDLHGSSAGAGARVTF
jgi:hypothetical protein